jgi:cystathionine beta-lyase/cystathionine gamma-synthase
MSGTSGVAAWLDPAGCPDARPPLARMAAATRELHAALDDHARATGTAWLHPTRRTVQLDLLGSPAVIAWQEAKAELMIGGDGAWSELPPLYARYGTDGTRALIGALRRLEAAPCVAVVDSGMAAVAAVADAILAPGDHAIVLRQVYNKTRTYLEWTTRRLGGPSAPLGITIVDDGDQAALAAAVRPSTRLVLAETFTNPLMRAQDVPGLVAVIAAARTTAPRVRLVIDSTIATPWALRRPLLAHGVDVVIGSLTKALGGQDTGLGGYIATSDVELANAVMDLLAMRGGILDDERARGVTDGLAAAEVAYVRRCTSAEAIARFLAAHPRVGEVFHPSRPDHPDAKVIARDYVRPGSIVSFRIAGADEDTTRHAADVLASCVVPRYALSFDGLATKVNHHRTVSEYFTPEDALRRDGFDRLIRLGVGTEDPDDVIACLNWTLHHAARVTVAELEAWRAERVAMRHR